MDESFIVKAFFWELDVLIKNKAEIWYTYNSRVTVILISPFLKISFLFYTALCMHYYLYMSVNTNHVEIVTARSFSSCLYLTRTTLPYLLFRFLLHYSYFNMTINILDLKLDNYISSPLLIYTTRNVRFGSGIESIF